MIALSGRRIGSIARAELLLLMRNRTALMNAVLPPVLIVGMVASAHVNAGSGLSGNAFLTTSLLGFVLLSTVYYTLVGTYVARRETLVLKRLRVGEVTDAEILMGAAGPAIVLALAQIVLFSVAASGFLGLPVPANAIVLLIGILGGVGMFALLAAASAIITRSVELAQITTLPLIGACLLGSGTTIPLGMEPGPVADVLRFLPLTPPLELMRLGWLGTTGVGPTTGFAGAFGAAVVPVAILAAWVILGAVAVRRWFLWEPRR